MKFNFDISMFPTLNFGSRVVYVTIPLQAFSRYEVKALNKLFFSQFIPAGVWMDKHLSLNQKLKASRAPESLSKQDLVGNIIEHVITRSADSILLND